jgi:cellulose synthase/poly-beta-1,6-N-acetylglucosamine synthase-like glycosyltransferase
MTVSAAVFWICFWLASYTYVLYPSLLFVIYALVQARRDLRYLVGRRDRRRARPHSENLPNVSLIIPACDEEARLPAKIVNLGELDYPPDKLDVIFVSDGSSDGTNEILRGLDGWLVQTIFLPERRGKANALNEAVARARHALLVFCDASTLLDADAIRMLARHFVDPTVGAVCGSLRFEGSPESEQTEGVYWRYESMLRLMEA